MQEIVSMIVANGLWCALFCVLLAYELKDSRRRESRYTATITSLSDRLGLVNSVKTDTEHIKSDTDDIKDDTGTIIKKLSVCSVVSGAEGGL